MLLAATTPVPTPVARGSTGVQDEAGGITVGWARHADEVRQAQRLRFEVFGRELGARLATPLHEHDVDRFDDYCEHLLVRSRTTHEVIGTYRLMTPAQAVRAGCLYGDHEFDLSPLDSLRPRMVELGRSCVHRDHRNGSVVLALWGALARFMERNGLDTMVGCATLGNPAAATRIWRDLPHERMAPAVLRVVPRSPLPDHAQPLPHAQAPALVQAYLRLGAQVLGPPAWDADFQSADLPMLMRTADLPRRFRQGAAGG